MLDPATLIDTYGIWAVAAIVAAESMGLPLPGETVLVSAAIYAGTAHRLDIVAVVAAAAAGAVIGDNIGFWVGRELGWPLLHRFGSRFGIGADRQLIGRYLFHCHGGKMVFLGRFVALLRALAAFLAGANRMGWPRFLVYNVAGGVTWAALVGSAGYLFGEELRRLAAPASLVLGILAVTGLVAWAMILRRHEATLLSKAKAMFRGE